MAKKSYNPFKMWGSYLGVIIFLIYLIYHSTKKCVGNIVWGMSCSTDFSGMPIKLLNIFTGINFDYMNSTTRKFFDINTILFIYVIFIILFLLGWGIHSLIRKLRR